MNGQARQPANAAWTRRIAPAPSFIARVLGRVRGSRNATAIETIVRDRRAARVQVSRATRLASTGWSYYAVVRRGEVEVFRRLEEHYRSSPDVAVIWDRRRQRPGNAGHVVDGQDQRVTPPDVWGDAPYVLVPKSKGERRPDSRG